MISWIKNFKYVKYWQLGGFRCIGYKLLIYKNGRNFHKKLHNQYLIMQLSYLQAQDYNDFHPRNPIVTIIRLQGF